MRPSLQGVTISVSDMGRSKHFYEQILRFEPDAYYAPTRWQPYLSAGRSHLALVEVADFRPPGTGNIVNSDVSNIRAYWDSVRANVDIEAPLGPTPWGSMKFVIRDPDGSRLGSVSTEKTETS
jgi:catechol 2,3-dioxygenase-like lactoylglutathione lyase family enzyme